ncbi:cysteine dioxygenase family protein [Leptolyngbya cf. ectocarpi LEGE 11479]|uniref:Cysteine dioxygenase family protein n=1 Tax=Leptolyngbya cf. ectocarpi LEGE 11479 TaxID=1828722 RepID=A0A929FCZ7_LEPEC|nr:cysteine dioxygenase family protein [Leptolyngbya ectocarpi]MBE9070524.1 cysteine dioxygenase family protein [Leptolyngbya cf. ectocarpi LEGE 11479]
MSQTGLSTVATLPIEEYSIKLQKLIEILQRSSHFTPIQVKEILLEVNILPEELMPWADFEHPVADSYGRRLVYDGGHFEIMVMSWVPGDFSAIHDHGAAQWGAVQCFGAAEHYIYRFSKGLLSTLDMAHYSPGMVRTVDHSLIHQMGNAGAEPFLSLHVYGCAKPKGSITGNARIFDLLEESIQYTDGGVFFCLPDDQINRRLSGVRGDRQTTFRHHQQMCDRIYRILQHQYNPELAQKLAILSGYSS